MAQPTRGGKIGRNRPLAKHRNILPNTYVPVYTKKVLSAVLGRLAKSSTVALVLLWPTLKNTQPVRPEHIVMSQADIVMSQADFARHVRDTAKQMKAKKWTKAKIIDTILLDFWPLGLNLLQLAQVDCQLIVDNPNAYFWVLSTVKDAWDKEVPMLLDPALFLDRLAAQLSNLFMSYIYVCRHPTFPLVLIRIQVFDLAPNSGKPQGKKLQVTQPHISSHRPYFLAVPMNSPHLIHSPGDDLVSQTVLQVVESSLARGPSQALHLETSLHQKPIRSLHSMQILKGSSRFAHSLGPWAPYADGAADISPLARHEHHLAVKSITSRAETFTTDEQKLQKLANVRFKGTLSGEIVSQQLFDNPRASKKRKVVAEQDDAETPRTKTPYASLAPISIAEFEIQEPLEDSGPSKSDTATSHVKIKFVGIDVFAGMHELSVRNTDLRASFIDLETLPGWLTGEEGESCGIVRNGVFCARDP
ncbi:CHL4-domain-containing protein [Metschnikowia bicuspidata var. bicuspidata NRRL YB-4993]|uniref:CHL4-domain-containing protein n=1 Tax=Metschnikowia bicuspidata var. bicuspidata NRRL YB-4993 TaxID=869754 RepID=A0A1A0HD43_9ASCO|nr:CHL4-domain-containing protein [Metschnikowia bicuspidata var. bicuspidata NRRL YB-4993]OBA21936.1 CHL4-domain-containing protein [Metschnikowia bicuspidata var. bicuspidata NRRL YB-4993]